jgi:hypothetical protein
MYSKEFFRALEGSGPGDQEKKVRSLGKLTFMPKRDNFCPPLLACEDGLGLKFLQ